ncbi:MAG: hypothetical protein OXF29_03105 [Hyphomicrobiales bacterium]|nr:hypothetical protein [Hyphomicrobiales bacterium]
MTQKEPVIQAIDGDTFKVANRKQSVRLANVQIANQLTKMHLG